MRPRHGGRGEPGQIDGWDRRVELLQCGRGTEAAENMKGLAVVVGADALQCGRGTEAAENANPGGAYDRPYQASMRPRHGGRGERVPRKKRATATTTLQCGRGTEAAENR